MRGMVDQPSTVFGFQRWINAAARRLAFNRFALIDDGQLTLREGKTDVVFGRETDLRGTVTIKDGAAQQTNFNTYRMIRIAEAPKVVSHFIDSTEHPSGLGEPTLPPAGGALANAIYKATGKRIYKQPFVNEMEVDVLG